MIIHSISAINLLKYRQLNLKDLPEQGTIAISGPNESGKSSIGETVCFALFGRSFAVAAGNVQKLIRWGEDRCSVTLEFSAQDGNRYQVTRIMDRDGNHSARLCKAEDKENPVARGAEPVAAALKEILGYDFDEFIESFYLAQREITTPHPHSYAVKIMAGVAPVEKCREEFAEEVERDKESAAESDEKVAEVAVELDTLAFDEDVLTGLEKQRGDLSTLDVRVGEKRESLLEAAGDYQEREPKLRAAESSRGTASFFRFVFFLLAAVALGLWAMITFQPDHQITGQIAEAIKGVVPDWSAMHVQWTLYAGIAFAVLFLLFWVRAGSMSGRMRDLSDTGGRLREEMAEVIGLEPDVNRAIGGDPGAGGGEETVVAQRLEPEQRDRVMARSDEMDASAEEVRSTVEREVAWLDRSTAAMQLTGQELDEQIATEKGRQEQHNKLVGMKEAFEQQAADHRHRIEVREQADQLLLGTARHLSNRFNQNLRGMAGKTLPMFTEGRYEHLKIDESLSVQAFSNEKRDFMDLDEISSGTQRQIMLALRLALSQELVNRVVKENQFVFLDEPFAFFDDSRTRSSLSVLPKLSEDVNQIFIIGQQFPDDMEFDMTVNCERGNDALGATAG